MLSKSALLTFHVERKEARRRWKRMGVCRVSRGTDDIYHESTIRARDQKAFY